jgi:hypothetical protein
MDESVCVETFPCYMERFYCMLFISNDMRSVSNTGNKSMRNCIYEKSDGSGTTNTYKSDIV